MAYWFQKIGPKLFGFAKQSVPAGIWQKCPECKTILYTRDLKNNLKVCLTCSFHFRLTGAERIQTLVDENSFKETNANISSLDPLKFKDSKKYTARLKDSVNKSKTTEAVSTGTAKINGLNISLVVFNFEFMAGSMGSVVGEKITRAIELAIDKQLPLLVVSTSGGARMQEGTFSLMQMAKTSAAIYQLQQARLPYVSLLTDPTTGGVSASFAMLGDIIIAEPKTLVCFAGPRVIEQTIKEKLPEGFQKAEFLLEHGSLDRIVERKNLKTEIHQFFTYMLANQAKITLKKTGGK